MSHKSKHHGGTISPSTPLPERIARARKEGRFQQALELARQHYKQNPTDESLALLREVRFERGEQLRSQGQFQEAGQTFSNIIEMDPPANLQRLLVDRLASCGFIAPALSLADRLGDAQLRAGVLWQLADFSLRKGARSLLPADLQPQFDAVLQAFAQAEAGKDEEARVALQTIGLTSPFMEWRMLLRGLLAYYAGDDARALENWQRLSPQRLPARLAAPLRFCIDPDFRQAQAPAAQNLLRQQFDRLQGSTGSAGALPVLRAVQPLLHQTGKLGQAFRQIENLLPTLRQQAPQLVPRLASCFRWAVIEHGQPEDLDRFMRVFGPPADDCQLHRMMALAMERNGAIADAHKHWQLFEKEVSGTNPAWPGDLGRRVRALIWTHIGKMAEDASESEEQMFLPFEPRRKSRPAKFHPPAEECFRRSLELAPDSLSTHQALVQCLLGNPDVDSELVFQAGKKLLEHFPSHVDTMIILASMYAEKERHDDAKEMLERALAVNPLDKTLRAQLVGVDMVRARELSSSKRFAEARTAYQTALDRLDEPVRFPLRCLAAIMELKAGNRQAHDNLLAEAAAEAQHRLLVVYCLMCESIRQKLPPARKKPLAQEFEAALAGGIEPELIPLLVGLVQIQRGGASYLGQKKHEKKILALVDKAPFKAYPEEVLDALCASLCALEWHKPLDRCVKAARRRFPKNPLFMLMEADSLMEGRNAYRAENLLSKARKLIEKLPRGDRQQMLLDHLQESEQEFRDLDACRGLNGFMNFFRERFYGYDPDEDEDEF